LQGAQKFFVPSVFLSEAFDKPQRDCDCDILGPVRAQAGIGIAWLFFLYENRRQTS